MTEVNRLIYWKQHTQYISVMPPSVENISDEHGSFPKMGTIYCTLLKCKLAFFPFWSNQLSYRNWSHSQD